MYKTRFRLYQNLTKKWHIVFDTIVNVLRVWKSIVKMADIVDSGISSEECCVDLIEAEDIQDRTETASLR